MIAEQVFGMIIMCSCCFGCGFIFLFIGIHSDKSDKPVGFWSGKEVKPAWVQDVSGYNKENARMWKFYCIPYFLSGAVELLSCIHEGFMIASLVMLLLAAIPGLLILIRHYRKIEKKYIDSEMLDKVDPFC